MKGVLKCICVVCHKSTTRGQRRFRMLTLWFLSKPPNSRTWEFLRPGISPDASQNYLIRISWGGVQQSVTISPPGESHAITDLIHIYIFPWFVAWAKRRAKKQLTNKNHSSLQKVSECYNSWPKWYTYIMYIGVLH